MADNLTVHGGQVHRAARELGVPLSDILDFSANINPLGPPRSVRRALEKALDDIRCYPDASHTEAKRVIANRYGVPEDSVLVSNGATEAIDLVLRALLPSRVWILEPAFSEYRAAAQWNRLPIASLPLQRPEFGPPWERLLAAVRPGDCVIWNNPHNPSGRHVPRSEFFAPLQALAACGVAILVDESFMDFLADDTASTALPQAWQPGSRIIVVRSLTKFLAIPGLRLGFAVADPAWVLGLAQRRDRWSVNHLAQQAVGGLQDHAFRDHTRNWLVEEQQRTKAIWEPTPLYQREPTSVNFFLIRWADAQLSRSVAHALFTRRVLIRLCQDFNGLGPTYWRVAIRGRDENARLYGVVQEILRQIGGV